jgi:peptidoglycan/xylan/chitin deacetylase (PgdA/CDA1 family)
MIGNVWVGVRKRRRAALCPALLGPALLGLALLSGLSTSIAAQTAPAVDCPGHPDAIGTSRTLVVDPKEHPRIGGMQYAETLPLADHEVVLTFDDGPLPRNSNQVLDILASQCVKATFFIIGQMAQAYPEGVRKLRDAGHTVGTHTQNHPLSMNKMAIEPAMQEIDGGIASVTAALGDNAATAPFFRIPGLLRAEGVENYLAAQGIQTWSADFPADDWKRISSSRVYELAMKRLEEKGKGILLLHDIQARTVAALPKILHELKARGYRIVHVVPATPELPATPTQPQQWQLHPPSETMAIAHWPKIPRFVFSSAAALAAPALPDSIWHDGQLTPLADPFDRARRPSGFVPLPPEAAWTTPTPLALNHAATTLPIPAQNIFEIQQLPRAAAQSLASSSPHVEQTTPAQRETDGIARLISADADESRGTIPGSVSETNTARDKWAAEPGLQRVPVGAR